MAKNNVNKMKTFVTWAVAGLSFLALTGGAVLADDSGKVAAFFDSASREGGVVTIPPGDYHLDGSAPIKLRSHTTVWAYGARFHLPERLGDKARVVLFEGENVRDFRWFGGHFSGHVFDPARVDNTWEPNVNTRLLLLTTTSDGATENLTIRDLTSDNIAGAAVTVVGMEKRGNEREVLSFVRNVTVENCTLERTGKFMWDYGYLWQITVWPEEYSEAERRVAARYFRQDLVRGDIRMEAGENRVMTANDKRLPVSKKREGLEADRGYDSVCFFGGALPANITRGRQYFVVESEPGYLKIAETPGGEAIRFEGGSGAGVKMVAPLFDATLALYTPAGSGPGKGAVDLVACENVVVRGCRLSALGDTMHIQKSRNISFVGNHITGSRMGAFFLAEFCKNATVIGNTVDGSNGSRVVSVEKSCEDVIIQGNTFRNGGRGSWINQPRNFILADNVFVNNPTKCERDPRRGRRSFLTGEYERYAELYFTTYEPGGRYGNILVRGNVFTSGPDAEHAIALKPGGDQIRIMDNIFLGAVRDISGAAGCENVSIRENAGLEVRP